MQHNLSWDFSEFAFSSKKNCLHFDFCSPNYVLEMSGSEACTDFLNDIHYAMTLNTMLSLELQKRPHRSNYKATLQ